jgi:hypothetical protein
MGTRDSFPGLKRLGRETDHSPPSSAELYLHSPIRLHGVVLGYGTGTILPYLYIYQTNWTCLSARVMLIISVDACHMSCEPMIIVQYMCWGKQEL